MATLVVDASVAVDLVAPKKASDPLSRLIDAVAYPHPVAFVAPDFLFLEVANAFRKMLSAGHLDEPRAERAMKGLALLPIATVPCGSLFRRAWDRRGTLTAYDAAYVGLAEELAVPLLTLDRRAVRAARALGVPAWHPDDRELVELLAALGRP